MPLITFQQARAALHSWGWKDSDRRANCPAHGGDGRSLSVRMNECGAALFHCFSRQCSTHDIVAALRSAPAENAPLPATAKRKPTDEKQRIEMARRIWREARDPRGTIVQDYLFGRGFTGSMPKPLRCGGSLAALAHTGAVLSIPASIRFRPRLWYARGVSLPAMVAAIEDMNGRIVAIHRTYLKSDGTGKAEVEPNKKALGPYSGCTVHLTAGAPDLVLCEGIETGLSILQATRLHVWVALGTSNLAQVELPDFVRKVVIAADNDEPGIKAAYTAAKSYAAGGRRVQIVSPRDEKWDFNDLLRRSGDGERNKGV